VDRAKRILFIAHRVPYPPDNGARVRAFQEICRLSEQFRVTVAAIAHNEADLKSAGRLRQWCERVLVARAGGVRGLVRGGLSLLTGGSVTEGYFQARRLRTLLRKEVEREPFDLVMAYCSSSLPYALAVPARTRVADLVDVDSAKWDSFAAATLGPKRWLYRREASTVRRLEHRAVEACDAVILISDAEVRVLGASSGNVLAVGNGVDTEYFKPLQGPVDGPPSLVFTGQMDYRPNVDGVCWFVRQVWPMLKRREPRLTFTIVGRNPTPAVQRLEEAPDVRVTGEVPDVRPYFAAATVAVCPLLIARGVQNKVLEAMATARPVVASAAAIEGLDVTVGQDLLQADTAEQFAEAVLGLLKDAQRRKRLGAAARCCIESHYTWSARMEPLVALCRRLTDGSAAHLPPQMDEVAGSSKGLHSVR
jgi:sugar transferase (PEP-CTERM/EpsH1 system associated)